jgi:hypothetical protein
MSLAIAWIRSGLFRSASSCSRATATMLGASASRNASRNSAKISAWAPAPNSAGS